MTPRTIIDDFLGQKSLALVGVSRSGAGFGNTIRAALAERGYTLFLVHPEAETIAGQPCFHELRDVADQVGGVILVTPPAETEKLVRDAAACGIPRVFMQQGAESDDAIRYCEAHGIAVVHHECILMFAEPTAWIHRAHRWIRGISGPPSGHVAARA